MTGKDMKKWRRIVTVLLAAGILLAFLFFSHSNSQRIQTQNAEYLYELTIQRAESINALIENNISFIRSTAYLYGETMQGKKVDLAVLKEFEDNSTFEGLRFVDSKGRDYTSEGIRANLADEHCFNEGMRGHSGVDSIFRSKVNGERQMVFYSPVYKGNKVDGVMLGIFGQDFIDRMIEYELFGIKGESWLCDRNGTIIGATLQSRHTDYFDYLERAGRCSEEELNNIRKVFAKGGNASLTYEIGGEKTYAYAASIEGSGWILVRSFPASASAEILSSANKNGIDLIMTLVVMFLAYVVIMSLWHVRQQEELDEERKAAESIAEAMSSLLEKVMRVDLDTLRYDYVIGAPNDSAIGEDGDYNEFCSSLLSQVSDAENYRTIADFLKPENLKKIMNVQDAAFITIRTRTGGREGVYCYKFTVTKKENGEAREVYIVSEDITNMIPDE